MNLKESRFSSIIASAKTILSPFLREWCLFKRVSVDRIGRLTPSTKRREKKGLEAKSITQKRDCIFIIQSSSWQSCTVRGCSSRNITRSTVEDASISTSSYYIVVLYQQLSTDIGDTSLTSFLHTALSCAPIQSTAMLFHFEVEDLLPVGQIISLLL